MAKKELNAETSENVIVVQQLKDKVRLEKRKPKVKDLGGAGVR